MRAHSKYDLRISSMVSQVIRGWLDRCAKALKNTIEAVSLDPDTDMKLLGASKLKHVRFGEGVIGIALKGGNGEPICVEGIQEGSLAGVKGLQVDDWIVTFNGARIEVRDSPPSHVVCCHSPSCTTV